MAWTRAEGQDQRERQRQATQRALAEQHHRDKQSEARMSGFIGILIGGVTTYMGWGTWWLVLGIFLILGGLYGLFAEDA